jgi:hypothetical protein
MVLKTTEMFYMPESQHEKEVFVPPFIKKYRDGFPPKENTIDDFYSVNF